MDLYQEELTKANNKLLELTEEIGTLKTEQVNLRAENAELKAKLNI
jgi:peptidoglycan hydrolase CwlO-like protein